MKTAKEILYEKLGMGHEEIERAFHPMDRQLMIEAMEEYAAANKGIDYKGACVVDYDILYVKHEECEKKLAELESGLITILDKINKPSAVNGNDLDTIVTPATEIIIKHLYNHLAVEFTLLQEGGVRSKETLQGYEYALWDLRMIANDNFSVELEKLEIKK